MLRLTVRIVGKARQDRCRTRAVGRWVRAQYVVSQALRIRVAYIYAVRLSLNVEYPDEYPDVLPELSLEHEDDVLDEVEADKLLSGMKTVVRSPIIYALATSFTASYLIGRGKPWHGHDLHDRYIPARRAFSVSGRKGRENQERGG